MSAERTPVLSLRGIEKEYRSGEVSTKVLHGIDLDVHEGELIAIVGPSGSGKSTLLNIIGCLDRPTTGHYTIAGHDVSELDIVQRARARSLFLGFVFQGFHLLPGTTALENVEMPLLYQGIPPEERRRRAIQALEEVGLKERLHHTPAQLSGGQQQRIALARAVVIEPDVLLLDEPLSALDANLREGMRVELKRIQRELGITTIFVTHDQAEALALSDKVVVMSNGKKEQEGAPDKVYNQPASRFVAEFLGNANLLPGRIESNGVKLQDGTLLPLRDAKGLPVGTEIDVVLRAERILLARQHPPEADALVVPGKVRALDYQGVAARYFVEALGTTLQVINPIDDLPFPEGAEVLLRIRAQDCVALGRA